MGENIPNARAAVIDEWPKRAEQEIWLDPYVERWCSEL